MRECVRRSTNIRADARDNLQTLLDTMSTETGERAAQAAEEKSALETVIEDTQAELAKLQRSKVASMIRLYQGEPSFLIVTPPMNAQMPSCFVSVPGCKSLRRLYSTKGRQTVGSAAWCVCCRHGQPAARLPQDQRLPLPAAPGEAAGAPHPQPQGLRLLHHPGQLPALSFLTRTMPPFS